MSHEFWAGFITAAVGWLVLSLIAGTIIGRAIGHNGDGE
jgi:hypothetical protein